MQAHRRGFQKWKWGHNTPRHWVWSLNCSVFWHQSQTGVKEIQTVLRPPPRVMLVHCSWLLTRASILRLNNDISVIGNSENHWRRGRIDSISIYGDITHWCGVLTKEIRTLRRSARARVFVIITLQTFLHHLMSFSIYAKLITQLNAPYCTLVYSARYKSNLNVTSVSLCIMHVNMHACNMHVAAHENYIVRAHLCLTLAINLTLKGLQYCICVHVHHRGLTLCSTHPIATPCLSYKLFVVNANKQCMIHKTYI